MATKLIQLDDGTLVEVEARDGEARPIAADAAERLSASLDKIEPLIARVCHSVSSSWDKVTGDIAIKQVEVELGLSFEGEGNVYVVKAKAAANLAVKIVLERPRTAR